MGILNKLVLGSLAVGVARLAMSDPEIRKSAQDAQEAVKKAAGAPPEPPSRNARSPAARFRPSAR